MAGEDPKYIAWLKTMPCCCPNCRVDEVKHRWNDRIDAHHRTGAGMGLRAHDHEAIPLGSLCHKHLHRLQGPFTGWSKQEMAAWQDWQIAYHRRLYRNGEAEIRDLPF